MLNDKKERPGEFTAAQPFPTNSTQSQATAETFSQQVSFWAVQSWVQPFLDAVGPYPPAGSPAWCQLPDDSRERWAALLDFARHHALRVETAQTVQAEAAKSIAAAADWSQIAREMRSRVDARRSGVRIDRG